MDLITIDFETYYDREYSLSKITTEEYVRSTNFEVIGVAVKVNNGETVWASGTHEELKDWLQRSFNWADSMVLAHNTMFDGAILSWRFGVHPRGWLDTLCMGRALHGVEVGGSLKALAERYGIGEKGTEVLNALGKRRLDFTPEELARYGDYCVNDVELTYKLFNKMSRGFPKQELKIIDVTLRMFTEPVLELDPELLERHLRNIQQMKEDLLTSCGVDKEGLMSNPKFAALLQQFGVVPPMKVSAATGKSTYAFAKNDEEFKALLEHADPRVQTLVAARLGTKSTLEETRTQRFIGISQRGKLPVPIRYYAAHTGRFGGDDKINLQNLPSRGANANMLKKAIVAPKGYVVIDADSAQIEARVLAWLAEQDDVVEAFATGKDVYKKMAAAIYAVSESDVTKDQRFVGKTTVLGCFGADTKVLTNNGWKRIVEVQDTDLVWDGESWVTHMGVVPKGLRETIRAWGVDATPEHEILTGHGWREWHEVVTNPSLSQSAFAKARSLSWSGGRVRNLLEDHQGGTLSYAVTVGGQGWSIDTTSRQGAQHGATLVQKLRHILKGIGLTSLCYQMNRTVHGYSTAFLRAYRGVTPRVQRLTNTMVVGASPCTPNGALTAPRFSSTFSPLTDGMTRNVTLTGSTTQKGTSRGTYGLRHAAKTHATNDESQTCRQKLMTYDIAYAGPNNRFTIATDAGPLIVHNCGYGMGALKFQAQLKTMGVEVDLEEARRIIDIYRRTNNKIAQLWRQAQNAIVNLSRGDYAPLGRPGVLELVPEERAIRLPSGLLMRYDDLSFSEGEKGPEFHYKTRKGRTRIYGGKVVENVCQAIARCIIAEQMLKISKRYKVVLTVHDAIAVCVRESEAEEAQKYVEECMRWVPEWAAGLPVNCESGVGKSYGDC